MGVNWIKESHDFTYGNQNFRWKITLRLYTSLAKYAIIWCYEFHKIVIFWEIKVLIKPFHLLSYVFHFFKARNRNYDFGDVKKTFELELANLDVTRFLFQQVIRSINPNVFRHH